MTVDRDTLVTHARDLQSAGESAGSEAAYVGAECRVIVYALDNITNAVVRRDRLGALMYLRLMSEIAMRLWWLIGPQTGETSPKADPAFIRGRVASLRKLDLTNLAGGLEAIAGQSGDEGLIEAAAEYRRVAAAIEQTVAPRKMEDMADGTVAGKDLYATYRQASSVIHAGALLGRTRLDDPPATGERTDVVAQAALAAALGLLVSLGVVDEPL